jgi:signal transduction histidine kinase
MAGELVVSGELWRGHRNRYFLANAKHSHVRMMIGSALFQATGITLLALGGLETWRVIGLGVAFLVFSGAQRFIVTRVYDPDRVDRAFFRASLAGMLFIVTCMTLTGGVHGPYIAAAVLPAIVPLLFFGPHPVTRGLTVLWMVMMIAVAALPLEITGPSVSRGYFIGAALTSLATVLFVVHSVFHKIAEAAHGAACSIDALREERMATAEDAHRRLHAVGSKVAHELKNPLAAIKGLVQLVARSPDSERTQERLAVVQAEVSRMETILREYLSFVRPIEDLKPEAVDPAAVVDGVFAVLAGRAEQGRIATSIDRGTGPAVKIAADPRRLREALLNLLANAVEATPAGGRIDVAVRPATGGGAVLDIRDTGRGIAADDLERLGRSFFTTRPDGTGLGVVLAASVVAQHGGTIHYASEIGRGTRVTVTLPASPTARPLPPAEVLTTSSRLQSEAA